MANEVTQLTINAAGTGWVDSVPSAVSTGYQAQNTNIQARAVGQDLSSVRASGTDIIIDISGPIDVDGIPFSVTSAVTLTPSAGGVFYIQVISGATATQKSLELTSSTPVWDASKNALYNGVNRVLNWVVYNTGSILRVSKLNDPQYFNASLGSENQTIGRQGFTRWLDVMPLTYPYYYDSFSFSETLNKICIINGDLYAVKTANVYHYSGISNTLLETITLPGSYDDGITYHNGNLILSSLSTVYIMDGISGTVSSSFALSGINQGIAVANGNLIRTESDAGGTNNYVRIHDGITSTVVSSIAVSTSYIRGITFDGYNIICGGLNGGGTASFIYVLKGQTSGIHMTLDGNGTTSVDGISDFAHDGKRLVEFNANNNTAYVHGFL